eukprot:CAMPEP_0172922180 /NCGR_PEP_ID=MMETSP1075-20121228/207334_1 /TAXON_ID=2916 /ORGANISM="Ceratium fusus, Strain PA161109" /LENGTH=106 /DNA_ID=CAMNT_0013782463 /DNA_START=29 /DNA_END=350 /DNA_ORIENTATION=+
MANTAVVVAAFAGAYSSSVTPSRKSPNIIFEDDDTKFLSVEMLSLDSFFGRSCGSSTNSIMHGFGIKSVTICTPAIFHLGSLPFAFAYSLFLTTAFGTSNQILADR